MISIIVPVYNVEKYLDKCIESITNQTYKDLEIILVDDGSQDKCPEICDNWVKRDNRIKVIHKKNGGVSSARNIGIESADGEYIGFVDSDDYIDQSMYKILLENLLRNGADISVCSSYFVYENGTQKIDSKTSDKICNQKEAVELISYTMNNSLWNKLFRKESIVKCRFDEEHTFGEDHLFLLQALKNVNKVTFCSRSLYYYVQHKDSITGTKFSKRSFDQIYMKDILLEFVEKNFPYLSSYYKKLCFTARENICRKILLSDSESAYKDGYYDCIRYMNENYATIKKHLEKREIIEYKMMCFNKIVYRIVFKYILRK